jgi:hypothetical protein
MPQTQNKMLLGNAPQMQKIDKKANEKQAKQKHPIALKSKKL